MQNDIDRDLYEILGVGHTASQDEIKKAYRSRARECHPDVAPHDPAAEHKFKELTFAYEVISDDQRRRDYDAYGLEGLRKGTGIDFNGFSSISDLFDLFFGGGFSDPFGGRRARGPVHGRDMVMSVSISLGEVASGSDREVELSRMATCAECKGTGMMPGTHASRCDRCGGTGQLRSSRRSFLGTFVSSSPCPQCNGAGEVVTEACRGCAGRGLARSEETLQVTVPPGVEHGDRLLVKGKGEGGVRGGRAGDLYVAIDVQPHDVFQREGVNLRTTVKVGVADAALGTEMELPSLDGEFKLKVPPGTQPDEVLRVKGKGLPPRYGGRRGEILVRVEVVVPKRLNSEQKKLLEALREADGKARR